MQQLSLSSRPKTLDGLVGQTRMVERIRGHIKNDRDIKAWLFVGPAGVGKTTTARIMAVSLQCQHQQVFGNPCKECWAQRTSYDIHETNCAEVTGIREIQSELEGTNYGPRIGKYRIYIMDEIHRTTEQAQGLMLKYLEDSPETTVFVLCTTAPHNLLPTLKRRCTIYKLHPLELEDIETYVARLLTKVKSRLPADKLKEALVYRRVTSPGLIAQAVEKYTAGANPDEAADVEEGNEVNTFALTRACVKGDWEDAAKFLLAAEPSDARGIRLNIINYVRKALLESTNINARTEALSMSLETLVALDNQTDTVMLAGVTAAVYKVCSITSRYKL